MSNNNNHLLASLPGLDDVGQLWGRCAGHRHALLYVALTTAILAVAVAWGQVRDARHTLLETKAHQDSASLIANLKLALPDFEKAMSATTLSEREQKIVQEVARKEKILQLVLRNPSGQVVYALNAVTEANRSPSVNAGKYDVAKRFDLQITRLPGPGIERQVKAVTVVPIQAGSAVVGTLESHVDESSQYFLLQDVGRNALSFLMALLFILGAIVAYSARRDLIRLEARETALSAAIELGEAANAELKASQLKVLQSERLSALGRVSATMSHEIRNPLGTIRTALYLIRTAAKKVDLNVDRPLERAERSVARCDNIVGDFLEYTRTNDVSICVLDAAEFLNDILDEQLLSYTITLTRDFSSDAVSIGVDPERFRRVIINLVENAAQAIEGSGTKNGEIVVSCHPHESGSVIRVRDNGPGIPEDLCARIFEPLFTTKSFGAGLGLPMVRQLVEQHKAELTVDTKPGVGTTFSVILPDASSAETVSDQQTIEGKKAA